MARDKTGTFNLIIRVAKEEFHEYGFEKASIRRIAKKVDIVPSAIYRHFKDKEALFSYFVEPALQEYDDICNSDMRQVYQMLDSGAEELIWAFSDNQFLERIRLMYKHYDAFKLLLTCSSGTKYSQFQHEIVEKDVKSTLVIWEELKKKGVPVRAVDEKDIHLITSGFASSLFEFIIHDFSEEEALKRSENLSIYFNSGLKSVLGV